MTFKKLVETWEVVEQEQTLKEEEGNVKTCVDEASTAVCVFNSLHK